MRAFELLQSGAREERAMAQAARLLRAIFASDVATARASTSEDFRWFGAADIDWRSDALARFNAESVTTLGPVRVIDAGLLHALPREATGLTNDVCCVVLADLTREGSTSTCAVLVGARGRVREVRDAIPIRQALEQLVEAPASRSAR